MGFRVVTDTRWEQLSGFIADAMGLHFPRERWPDLQHGLAGAATEFGFKDVAACADWLLSAPPTSALLQTLASHLTIGETYFFREKQTFEVLAHHVLPGLIQSRRGREQRLRLFEGRHDARRLVRDLPHEPAPRPRRGTRARRRAIDVPQRVRERPRHAAARAAAAPLSLIHI